MTGAPPFGWRRVEQTVKRGIIGGTLAAPQRYSITWCNVCDICSHDELTGRCIYGGPYRGYIRVPVNGDKVRIEPR